MTVTVAADLPANVRQGAIEADDVTVVDGDPRRDVPLAFVFAPPSGAQRLAGILARMASRLRPCGGGRGIARVTV